MLSKLISWLCGSESAGYLTQVTKFSLNSWVSPWLFPFLAAGIVLFVFYSYRREKILSKRQYIICSILRSLAYLCIFFVLAHPKIELEGSGNLPSEVPVVVDTTLSMRIADGQNDSRRIDDALKATDYFKVNNPSPGTLDLCFFTAGKNFERWTPKKNGENPEIIPDGDATSLGQMLENAQRMSGGHPISGIILISDGANNTLDSLGNNLMQLKKKSIPVYTVGTGRTQGCDSAIFGIAGEDVVFVNEKAKADVLLRHAGSIGREAKITLTLEGEKKDEQKELYRGEYRIEKDGDKLFPVDFMPEKTGVYRLKAELQPLPGEATDENNIFIRNIRVIDQKIRVLLVFGSPSWEYRYLTGAFARDPRVSFRSYLKELDSRKLQSKKENDGVFLPQLPLTEDELNKDYDVVIVSRVDATQIPEKFWDALTGFTEKYGGGVVFMSDPYDIPYTLKGSKAEALIPMTIPGSGKARSYRDEMFNPLTDEFRFAVTEDGVSAPLVRFSSDTKENTEIWKNMPGMYYCYSEGNLKPSAVNVLAVFKKARHQTYPAIVQHSYGKGSVLFLTFDSTWRWRKGYGERFFREFWGKTVQSLGLPHLLEESAQSSIQAGSENVYAGDKIVLRAKIFDRNFMPVREDKIVVNALLNGKVQEITMTPVGGRSGIYKGDFAASEPGLLRLMLPEQYGGAPLELRILPQNREFVNAALNEELLNKIAMDTNGKYFKVGEISDVMEHLVKNRRPSMISATVSLWDSYVMLILTLLLFSAEWVCRKLYCLD